jgi:hypothetical protein
MEVGCIIQRQNSNCIRTFIEEFNGRFSNFKARKILIKVFSSPSLMEIDATTTNLQLEFADFHSESALRNISVTCHLLISIQNTFLPKNTLKPKNMLC